MPRPKTKEELVLASKENYEKLNLLFSLNLIIGKPMEK